MSGAAAPAVPAAPAPVVKRKMNVSEWPTQKVTRVLRMANMANGACMILTGILVFFTSIIAIQLSSFVSTVTVACYVVLFGAIMACLECNCGGFTSKLRKNFGFMFTYVGRTVFIIFSGTMVLAMQYWLAYLVGAATFANGLFNCYILCVHPAFRSGELSRTGDPYGGYSGGTDEMLAYIKSKPTLANKVTSAAVSAAAQNPSAAGAFLGSMKGAGK